MPVNIHIGCPVSTCTKLRKPFPTIGSVFAALDSGISELSLGSTDDQFEAGVLVSSAALNINDSQTGWSGGHFTLTNNSSKGLVAFRVTFHISGTTGETLQFSQNADAFLAQSTIAPGQSIEFETGTKGSFKSKVSGVSVNIDYVELSDGTLGGYDAASAYHRLAIERTQAIIFAKSLAAQVQDDKTDSQTSLLSILAKSRGEEDAGTKLVRMLVGSTVNKKGASAGSDELRRIAALKPPPL